jgi:invasion protein IalB
MGLAMCIIASGAVSSEILAEERFAHRFGEWELTCGARESLQAEATKSLPASKCKVVQHLAAEGSDAGLLSVSILASEHRSPVAVVSVPLGGYIVPGIEFSIDEGKPYKLHIETCTTGGCHAGFPLSGRVVKELRAGNEARFRVWTAKREPVDLTVSLKGLSAALTEMERRS